MSPLLNYTTTISATKTASEMQAALAKAGATHVSVQYGASGAPIALSFAIATPHGARDFLLLVRPAQVVKVLNKQGVPHKYRTPEQAERVAWRILKDWLLAQLAITQTEMVTLDEVMLPYMTDSIGRTVYDLYASRQLALGAGSEYADAG
jgi:hypothetical protein